MHTMKTYRIRGLSPTMLNNGRMADPLDEYAKKLKVISHKRVKTDADYEEMAKVEWYGSLYVDEAGAPCWPGENIEAMLIAAAKKKRLGVQAKAGILSDGNWPIIHKGPSTADELWTLPEYRDRRKARVKQASVMRTRPIFRVWELEFTVAFQPDLLNEAEVDEIVAIAGEQIGLSDFRPKFGRFEVLNGVHK